MFGSVVLLDYSAQHRALQIALVGLDVELAAKKQNTITRVCHAQWCSKGCTCVYSVYLVVQPEQRILTSPST